MPYRNAYLGVILLLVLAGFAFWPSYFSRLAETRWPFHLHGVTATLWMLLLIAQNVTIHQRRRALHRQVGIATLMVIPLFSAAGLMMVHTMNAADSEFATLFGPRLGFVDAVAVVAFAGFCYAALANRRNPFLHGGYMLVTALLLVMATVSRLNPFNYLERLAPEASRAQQFDVAFDVSTLCVFLAIAALYLPNRRHAAPFVAIGAVTIIQWVGYYRIDQVPVWGRINDAMAAAPMLLMGAIGLAIGIAAVGLGWRASGSADRTSGDAAAATA